MKDRNKAKRLDITIKGNYIIVKGLALERLTLIHGVTTIYTRKHKCDIGIIYNGRYVGSYDVAKNEFYNFFYAKDRLNETLEFLNVLLSREYFFDKNN